MNKLIEKPRKDRVRRRNEGITHITRRTTRNSKNSMEVKKEKTTTTQINILKVTGQKLKKQDELYETTTCGGKLKNQTDNIRSQDTKDTPGKT